MRCLFAFHGKVALFLVGMRANYKYKDIDYSEYLGKDYKEKLSTTRAPTIIANHSSWLDALILMGKA